jgi:hypothetical protein
MKNAPEENVRGRFLLHGQESALMKPLRYKAVEQKTLFSP